MFTKVILVAFFACALYISTAQAENTVEQCEKQMPASLKGKLCDIRQYKIVPGADADKHMDCVMKAVGFVDAEGRGEYHKLYKPLNAVEKHRKHDYNLEKCMGDTMNLPKEQRANGFYKCLLQSSSGNAFKKVFDLTELVKAGKLSSIAQYSPAVEKIMKKIDEKICK
uniref:Short form D7 salivary protein n=1 Tax=Anopheles farauti TaxID=69004 RepID=A0A182QZE4_9DIPT